MVPNSTILGRRAGEDQKDKANVKLTTLDGVFLCLDLRKQLQQLNLQEKEELKKEKKVPEKSEHLRGYANEIMKKQEKVADNIKKLKAKKMTVVVSSSEG